MTGNRRVFENSCLSSFSDDAVDEITRFQFAEFMIYAADNAYEIARPQSVVGKMWGCTALHRFSFKKSSALLIAALNKAGALSLLMKLARIHDRFRGLDKVKALVLMTGGMRARERRPGTLEFRVKVTEEPEVYRQWLETMRHTRMSIDPKLRERLIECHRTVDSQSQHHDFVVRDHVQDRIQTLKPPLLGLT